MTRSKKNVSNEELKYFFIHGPHLLPYNTTTNLWNWFGCQLPAAAAAGLKNTSSTRRVNFTTWLITDSQMSQITNLKKTASYKGDPYSEK